MARRVQRAGRAVYWPKWLRVLQFPPRWCVMPERYKVRVEKESFTFCSGHFISYEGDKCERLHGHNYRTAVEIEGELDENRYVFDFIALKHRTQAIHDELDHRMMLPTRNRVIHLEERPGSVRVR